MGLLPGKQSTAVLAFDEHYQEWLNAESFAAFDVRLLLCLPGHVLKRYHVVFDYPAGRFTLAQPGTVKPRGVRLATPIGTRSGFPRIELKIGDETHGFLLDTGATYTMISQELLEHWSNLHPDWKRITGAVGAANMMGGSMETKALMMRLPKLNRALEVLRQQIAQRKH